MLEKLLDKFRDGTGKSAFDRLSTQDGKLVALRAAAEAKKAEAQAVHASLDEIDKILGE